MEPLASEPPGGLQFRMAASANAVLHISGDFPDPFEAKKTKVIQSLLDLTAKNFDHYVFSLNRVAVQPLRMAIDIATSIGSPHCRLEYKPFAYGEALTYAAPGKGLFHATYLKDVARQLADRVKGNPPTLVAGHKLTIEGIVARELSRRIGRPYCVTIQGDTDTKILLARPDLWPLLRRVFHEAAHVFCFAPWALEVVQQRLGLRGGPTTILPCPTEIDEPIAPVPGGETLVSVFHLQSSRRKNLRGMTGAMALLAQQGFSTRLAIHGGGGDNDRASAEAMVRASPYIDMHGPVGRDALPEVLNRAIGFVLPSHRETFGLVFIEALFAGLPILYPQGQAVTGYFDDLPFAIPVDANDTGSIAKGIKRLINEEASLKVQLSHWQRSEAAERFRRPGIARAFAMGLNQCASTASNRY